MNNKLEGFIQRILKRLLKSGEYTLIVAIVAIALSHWGVFVLDKIPIPHFVDILYGYIVLNSFFAGPFIYLERKAARVSEIMCPKCRGKLEAITNYNCPNCGRLEYQQPKD
jgi:hypothetical protein